MLGNLLGLGKIVSLAFLLGLVPARAQQPAPLPLVAITDPASGMRVGIPEKTLVKRSTNASGGARWQDKDEKITLDLLPFKPGEDLAVMFAKGTAANVAGRTITRKDLKPDHFIILGETAGGKFIRRMEKRADGAIGGFSLGYDKALSKSFDALAVQITASFVSRPSAAPVTPVPAAVVVPPVSPRKSWFIATLIAEDTLVTSGAAISACKAMKFNNSTAQLIKRDEASGLALLKLPANGTALQLAGPVPARGFAAMRDEDNRLELTPARFTENKVEAAIQIYGGGASLLDESGRLIGISTAPPASKFRIASAVPTMRHTMIPADQIASFAGLPAPGKPGEPLSLGKVAASIRTAIFEMTCEM